MKKRMQVNKLSLQIFAMATMLVDHVGEVFFPEIGLMRCIGRLAFPIFAFFVAEGYIHTHNFWNYVKRMSIFALLAEIPFDLAFFGRLWDAGHQNTMWTFVLSLLCLYAVDYAKKRCKEQWIWLLCTFAVCLTGYLAGNFFHTDYHGFGVLTVMIFYLCNQGIRGRILSTALLLYVNLFCLGGRMISLGALTFSRQGLAVLSLPLLWLYKGEQGPHNKKIQYFCYGFYPAHLLIIGLIALKG